MAVVVVTSFALTAPLVYLQRLLLRQAQRYVSVRGKGLKVVPLKLGSWRWPAFAAIMVWFCATVVIPLAGITVRSFRRDLGRGVTSSTCSPSITRTTTISLIPLALTVVHDRISWHSQESSICANT